MFSLRFALCDTQRGGFSNQPKEDEGLIRSVPLSNKIVRLFTVAESSGFLFRSFKTAAEGFNTQCQMTCDWRTLTPL
jgi:hypothetical protein